MRLLCALGATIWRRRFAGAMTLIGLMVVGYAMWVPAPKVLAQGAGCPPGQMAFGRQLCDGYFTGVRNTSDPSPDNAVFYNGLRAVGSREWVANINEYVALMKGYLFDDDGARNVDYGSGDPAVLSVQNTDALRNNIGAANHIDIMLGKNGPDFGNNRAAGIQFARDNFAQWESIVRNYDSKGQILYQVDAISLNGNGSRIEHSTGQPPNNQDNEFFESPFYLTQTIRFNDSTGKAVLQIEMDCGNIFGIAGALVQPPDGTLNPPTPATPGVPPGYTPAADPTVYSSCSQITGRASVPSTPAYSVPVRITFSGGATGSYTVNASTSGNHTFSYTTQPDVRNAIKAVQVSAVGILPDGVTTFNLANSPITIGPCLLPNGQCEGFVVDPTEIDPNTPYKITGSVNYNDANVRTEVLSRPDTKFFVTVNGPGVNRTITSASVAEIQQYGVGGLRYTTPLQPPTGQTGLYAVGWGITGSYGAVNCGAAIVGNPNPPTFPVTKKPYFNVDGGDVSAGAGMSTGGVDCSAGGGVPATNKAGIVSWNRDGATYDGAGTKYAALALGHLQGFATGQGSGQVPSGVAFGNTGGDGDQVDLTRDLFGGEFGSSACTADYFSKADPAAIVNSDLVLAGRSIANGTHQTIYVKGNVYITGNIVFAGAGSGYGGPSGVPSFSVIVQGNIYIDPNVTQLDGFYIAQPTNSAATNGIIYSCAPSGFGTNAGNVFNAALQASCDKPLTVYGAFVGRQIWLLRTAGSISTTPAESFNYAPELWLSAPFGNGLSPATTDDYDAITSLPPVL